MNIEGLFPGRPESRPTIYAYAETRPELAGLLKVGYTDHPVEARTAEHYPTKLPDGLCPYRVVLIESVMRRTGRVSWITMSTACWRRGASRTREIKWSAAGIRRCAGCSASLSVSSGLP